MWPWRTDASRRERFCQAARSALSAIDPGHKVAISPDRQGEAVVKYAQAIGRATEDIAPGTHIHSHNLVFESGRMPVVPPSDAGRKPATEDRARTFMGYRRADGRAGTRNFVGIIASVNCSTTVCRSIAERANRELLPEYSGIDGFVPIVHDQGCGMSGTGEGMQILHRTLAGYARHPNFGGILMVGLGCEVNQLTLYGQKGIAAGKRHFNIQEAGGSRKSVEKAMDVLREICDEVGNLQREPIPVSEIVVGLQCGGSDGMSGITANPALGAAVDILAASGGTGILSETTEIYGAEHLLASRATSPEVAEKLDGLIKWWEAHVQKHGASIDNNPSPGNKRGGLTTILEKSLGAVAKGRLHTAHRRLSLRGEGHEPRPGLHGHAGLRSCLGDRSGCRRGQYHRLHHRTRLVLRLPPDAIDQGCQQLHPLQRHGRGHGCELRRHRLRRQDHRSDGP